MANTIESRKRLTVYIGRFQPFHLGHANILEQAIETSDKVLVLVGSAYQARNIKNPFTFTERFDMISRWTLDKYRLVSKWPCVKPLRDQPYNNAKWLQSVQETVDETITEYGWDRSEVDVSIIGADKDDSSWYLKSFPQYQIDIKPTVPEGKDLSATHLRKRLFTAGYLGNSANKWNDVPKTTWEFINEFSGRKDFARLCEEYEFNANYKSPYATLLYQLKTLVPANLHDRFDEIVETWLKKQHERMFVTADACIIQSGHVLVVRRGALPGKGLIALPGGFVKGNQTLLLAAVEQAIDSTGLKLADGKNWRKITESILRGSLVSARNFDDPDRSLRGRTFATCHLFRLDDMKPLPGVKGKFTMPDDGLETEDAFWMPISLARAHPEWWYEDNHAMLDTMLGLIKD